MKRLARFTALVLAPFLAAMAQPNVPAPAWLDPDRSEWRDARYSTFKSRLAGGEVSYRLYLPPGYEASLERRYPVVYWLHGLGDRLGGPAFAAALNASIQMGQTPPVIAVLVNGMRDTFYCDSPDGKWPVESVIIKELIPHVDQTYRTLARRESRIIEGYSMGGWGAAHLGFKYPEVFGIVGAMAGALVEPEIIASPQSAKVHPELPGIFQKMWGSDPAYVQANDPLTLARKNADAIRGRTFIRIAVGDQEGLQHRDQALHELLRELKIDHEYEVLPGFQHRTQWFYQALGERAFRYYAKALKY